MALWLLQHWKEENLVNRMAMGDCYSLDCRIMDETLISVCLSSDHHHRCNIAAVESDRKKFIGGEERNSRELIGPLLHDSVCQCLATKMTCRQKDVAY